MTNVIELPVVTFLDIPVERIIRKAGEANLETVVIVGWDADGELYFAGSVADGGEVLWLLEKAKRALLE